MIPRAQTTARCWTSARFVSVAGMTCEERSAALYMACGTPFSDYLSFVIIHLGVSHKTD